MSDCNCETKLCVSCDVKNCVHHTAENTCAAGRIKVSSCNASTCGDTCCDTFKAR